MCTQLAGNLSSPPPHGVPEARLVLGCSLRLDNQEHVSMCRGAHPDHSTFLVTYFFHFFVVSLYLCILAVLCFLLRRLFSSCGQQGLFFIAVFGLLTGVAFLVVGHGL